ncbi:phasin [Pseudochelatococcus contaminans]|uniref:Phasin n=1 Tax=Pseudochelatococcus contaminans TaxID=1538103 RepID=A0A7W5Z443_9HYPH|nr:phasin [Pseudochelatococcus contaminans]MBB3809475.1 phasin [Pseudochelatococcus contaminans]
MTNTTPNYEIPAELREFAEKSVEQARKAFDGYLSAAHKAVAAFENQSTPVPFNTHEVARRTLSYAETNVGAAFDLAEKLVRAKDLREVSQYQNEYLKNQFAALQEQARDFGSVVQKSASEATQHVQNAVKEATNKATEATQAVTDAAKDATKSHA